MVFPLWYNILVWTLAYSFIFLFIDAVYSVFVALTSSTITREVLFEKVQGVFTSKWNDEEVLSLKRAWGEIILPCLPHRNFYQKLWEVPFFGLFSFYTLIRTRFNLIQIVIIYRGFLLLILFGDSTLLRWYCGLTLLLTAFASLPAFKRHFEKVYSPNLLKMLGWNTVTKAIMSQASTGAKVAVVGAGLVVGNEVASPYVGQIRAGNYALSVHQANDAIISVNKVLTAHGQATTPLQQLDGEKIIRLQREANLLREGLNAVREVLPFTGTLKGKIPPLPPK